MANLNKPKTLKDWCERNGYSGLTKECMLHALNSDDKEVKMLAQVEKIKQLTPLEKIQKEEEL